MVKVIRFLSLLVAINFFLFCGVSYGAASRDLDNTTSSGADYIDYGDAFYSDDFSYCAWIKVDNLGASLSGVVVKRNNSSDPPTPTDNEMIGFISSSGTAQVQVFDSGGSLVCSSGKGGAGDGDWHHVCFISQGNGGNCYASVDGVFSSGSSQTAATGNTASSLQLGARSSNNDERWLDGKIAYFKAYHRDLTEAEVKEIMYCPEKVPNGARIYSPLLGFNPEKDYTGNGNTGTLHSSPPTSNDGPPVGCGVRQ